MTRHTASSFPTGRAARTGAAALLIALAAAGPRSLLAQGTAGSAPERPFGTLREQAELQQQWLDERMRTALPALMRESGIDTWVIPMREYNEDPTFTSLVSPTTFAARRRTIYLFHDACMAAGRPAGADCALERIALGGTSQGGVYTAVRADQVVDAGASKRPAELWGDSQWRVLRRELERRAPKRIGINVSRTFAFADGLTAAELEGMKEGLGAELSARLTPAESLPVAFIATRVPGEAAAYERMNALVWEIIGTAFSNQVITPGVTTTQDVVWWLRQRVNDLGLTTWFQPSVSVQRSGATEAQLGDNPVIQSGDVLWTDFGLTAMRLNTDTQHMGYVLRAGETEAPAGLRAALTRSNRLQDIVMAEIRPGRTGNEILAASLARMKSEQIDGTVYTHPIGTHGHGAGPLIGLWDRQEGVPGRGDAKVLPNMWYSIELQATSPIPEWNGQRVRMAQEEDMMMGADGVPRWAHGRQTTFHLVRPAGAH